MNPTIGTSPSPSNADKSLLFPYYLLIAVFIFAGLIGHDPWKADEAYIFGVIQHMVETSDWVVPMLGGEPFMEKPPLFYWVATAFARALSPWPLPLHDGARIAAGFFMMVTCGATAAATHLWWGRTTGRVAALVLLSCLGTLVQSHMMMPDVPLLTGFALSALGFAMLDRHSLLGGAVLGLGIGIGFMSKGLIAPAVIGVTAIVLPLSFRHWRTRSYGTAMLWAAIFALPWCLIWPTFLYLRSPQLFMDWFWLNNFGRFFGFSVGQLGAEHLPWFWTKTLPWYTFPGLPLALWFLWQKRDQALSEPAIQYAVVAAAVMMTVLALSSSGRCVYAWPLLVPIAIHAAPGASMVPRRIEHIWVSASLLLFGLSSLAIWTGWVLIMVNGSPPQWPALLRFLPAQFLPQWQPIQVMIAAVTSIGAPLLLRALWNKPGIGLTTWALGITLTWTLLTTLWMPWLDFAKSYRSVFATVPVRDASACIASRNLGEGERAMFRYVVGVNTIRVEVSPNGENTCSLLLIQSER